MSDELTMPLLPDQVAIPLEGLAGRINEAHSLTVEHACRAGEWLLQAKRHVQHGEWQAWLADNVQFSDRTARGYMRVAKNLPKLEENGNVVADLPLREALKYLASPKVDDEPLAPEAGDPETGDPTLHQLAVDMMAMADEVGRIEALMPDDIKARKGMSAEELTLCADIQQVARNCAKSIHFLERWMPLWARANRHHVMAVAAYLEHPEAAAKVDGKPKKYAIRRLRQRQAMWTEAWLTWSDELRELGSAPEWAGEMPAGDA